MNPAELTPTQGMVYDRAARKKAQAGREEKSWYPGILLVESSFTMITKDSHLECSLSPDT